MKVLNHIDIQFNRLKTVNVDLVSTRDVEKHTEFYDAVPVFNQPIGFWMNQNILRKLNLVQYLTIPVIYGMYILYRDASIIHVNILLGLLAFMSTLPFYTINVFQRYAYISNVWCIIGVIASICSICYISIQILKNLTPYYAVSLFIFHMVLMLNIIHILAK